MSIKELVGINPGKNNVFRISLPYLWSLNRKETGHNNHARKMVIFFGSDMSGLVKLGFADKELYIARCNECLDYVRRNFGDDYDLFYKPHPADERERLFLDLKGFNLIQDKMTAELFLWKNSDKIKSVFAINSWSAVSACGFGLNAYLFNPLFKDVYEPKYYESVETYLAPVPEPLFINGLEEKPAENKKFAVNDAGLEREIQELFSGFRGAVWLVISHTEFVMSAISLARLIKSLSPGARINLAVSRHSRWDFVGLDDIGVYFDEIKFFPRIFYSLEPRKLFSHFKTAMAVRKLNVNPEDIIISFSQVEFLENCFLSYYRHNKRVGFISERDFNFNYNSGNPIFSNNYDFRFAKASWFYNKIWEPILGLNKTAFLIYDNGELYVTRYQKAINDVFSKVFICKPSE